MFIDSHAHLTSDTLYDTIDAILERAQSHHIDVIINICTCPKTLERGRELVKRYPWVYQVAATTPHDVEKEGEEVFSVIEAAAHNNELVAIGETGLDYYYTHSKKEIQHTFLRRYLRLAKECDLPVVIHCRDAFEDFFKILDEEYKGKPGVLHCFTGNIEEAKEVLDRGWYLSLSGIVTYKKSEELQKVAKFVPLNRLFIETDSPYLAPQKVRGKTNEPAYLPLTAQKIADLKGITIEEVASQTSENVRTLLRLKSIK
jgi:TatD DNase family protein